MQPKRFTPKSGKYFSIRTHGLYRCETRMSLAMLELWRWFPPRQKSRLCEASLALSKGFFKPPGAIRADVDLVEEDRSTTG